MTFRFFKRVQFKKGRKDSKVKGPWIRLQRFGLRRWKKGLKKLPEIPEVIISNILSRLPIKSLSRFKCINKHWNAMISSPNFTLSNCKSKAVLMSSKSDESSIEYTRFLFVDTDFDVETLQCNEKYDSIAGSCNGLLLLVKGSSFFLLNPSTRFCRKVLELEALKRDMFTALSGICYDGSTDDYKVVIALDYTNIHSPDNCEKGYTLLAGLREKRWKEVNFSYRADPKTSALLFNGFLHWKVICEDPCFLPRGANKIVRFDPKNDEFGELPMPQDWESSGETTILHGLGVIDPPVEETIKTELNFVLGLGVLDSCLCMAYWPYQWDGANYCEGNAKRFEPFSAYEKWTSCNDSDWVHVLIYNPETMTCKNVYAVFGGAIMHNSLLVESLASPIGYEWNDEQHQGLGKDIIWLDGPYSYTDSSEDEDWNEMLDDYTDFHIETLQWDEMFEFIAGSCNGLKEKRWKDVSFAYRAELNTNAILFNGFLHWKLISEDPGFMREGANKIVRFDPKKDEFQELPLPREWESIVEETVILGLGFIDPPTRFPQMHFALDEKGAIIHDSILFESLVSPIGYEWNDKQQGLGTNIIWPDGPYSYSDSSDDDRVWNEILQECSQDLKENETFDHPEDANEICFTSV
ncbi:hypothetical protein ACH5RR_031224 [Cinchona calisaya]|uniref:F-box domain-containing protein n=1 Tax=Cinchona calisaya TaxID=153742 RepID=A0ABD2YEL3_9GENT